MTHATENTGPAVVRRLWPSEAALFRQHFDRLDTHSRAMRFGGAVHDTLLDAYVHQALAGKLLYRKCLGVHGRGLCFQFM